MGGGTGCVCEHSNISKAPGYHLELFTAFLFCLSRIHLSFVKFEFRGILICEIQTAGCFTSQLERFSCPTFEVSSRAFRFTVNFAADVDRGDTVGERLSRKKNKIKPIKKNNKNSETWVSSPITAPD